jgi:flavin-binding protein dodecin
MSNRTYRVTELVGTSPDGIDEAIRNAVRRASSTLRHVDWFEVTQVRGQVKDD